jgi:hypothetical protein
MITFTTLECGQLMNALDNWDVANAFDGVEEGHRPMTATLGVTMTWQGRTVDRVKPKESCCCWTAKG